VNPLKKTDTKPIADILIVDDESFILTSLKRMLYGEPYRVHTASGGEEALQMMEQTEMGLIISDFRMPEMDGIAFLQEVKKRQPDSVRIILSGYADISAIIDAINQGEIFKFIAKPWNDDELKLTIIQSLEHWQLRKNNRELTQALLDKNAALQDLNDNLELEVAKRSRELFLKDKRFLLSQYIIENIPVALIGVDENDMVALANRKAAEILPENTGSIGSHFQDVFDNSIVEMIQECRQRGEAVATEMRIKERPYTFHSLPVQLTAVSGNTLFIFIEQDIPVENHSRHPVHEHATLTKD
jgi:response regulator RpfG family c-di-GMP phosphodiesterase